MLIGDLKQRIANVPDDAEICFNTEEHFCENDMWPIKRIVVLTTIDNDTGETTTTVCFM